MAAEAKTCRLKDGRELTFLFDIEGVIAAEDAADTSFDRLLTGAGQRRRGHLRALAYGGLRARNPEVTLADAWELLSGGEAEAVGSTMIEAIESALPPRRAVQNPPKGTAAPDSPPGGTGSRSSPSGSKKASPRKGSGSRLRAASKSS